MFEAAPQEESVADKLVRQILTLQKAVLPEMVGQNKKTPESTLGGVGSYALKDLFGRGGVRLGGRSWMIDELAENAIARIHLRDDSQYRVDIREGQLTGIYTQNGSGVRVEDEATMKKLRLKVLRKHLAFKAINLKNSVLK